MPICSEAVGRQRKAAFQRRALPTFIHEEGDMRFTCYLLPQEDVAELPNAVLAYLPPFDEFWRQGGDDTVVIAIDERVPENVRRHAISHEIWRDLLSGAETRFVDAAKREIKAVKEDGTISVAQAKKYFRMRRTYWSNLISLGATHPGLYPSKDLEGYRATWAIFEQEVNPNDD